MPDDRHTPESTEAERQAQRLAAQIDAAADDLERNGPVPPEELRQRLLALEAEWAREAAHTPPGTKAERRRH
jgi:hypothetical protein